MTPHILKHTAISDLLGLGFSTNQLAEFTSTSEETVKLIYRKLHGWENDAMAKAQGTVRERLRLVKSEGKGTVDA